MWKFVPFFKKKHRHSAVKSNAGKLKEGYFDLPKIERYFHLSDKVDFHQVISDRTCQDLDLNEVFMYLDRTTSKIGQQILYQVLRTIPTHSGRVGKFEKVIQILKGNADTFDQVRIEIANLKHKDAYNIPSLFLEKHLQKPKWFWVMPMLSMMSICLIALSFVLPQALVFLFLLLAINLGFHYWNKIHMFRYSSSIPQLLKLNQAAKKIAMLPEMLAVDPDILHAIKSIDGLGVQMSLFKLEAKLQSEIGMAIEYVVELLKALFLIEPLVLYHVLEKLDSQRAQIQQLYHFVGDIDVAMSIHFLREDLPYCCVPTTLPDEKQIKVADIYHPLIYESVANSIHLDSQSALLTGSNMSGKTTFIRTMGINVILAQTLNTCCAKSFCAPMLKIHSAIRISDDLISDKSYYMEEVQTIHALLKESDSGFGNLFLLDELFKGTNTVERIASGKAVLTYLNKGNNMAFVATHDLELAELLADSFAVFHFTEVVQNGTILFDYIIKPGKLINTNAIRILELNGYPAEVIAEAIQLANEMYQRNNKLLISTQMGPLFADD